jgi:TATA-box binding protein (TBP) (component of TFIID and TFIIIB)
LNLDQSPVMYYMRLDDMHRENNIYCTYQRKMFPGLIYRPDNSPIVLLLFQSGKIVVTGGKSVHDMQQGWVQLWQFVMRYVSPVQTPQLLPEV